MHWLGRNRFLVLGLICFFWTGLMFVGHFFPGVPFISAPWRGEQSFEDLLRREGRTTPAPPDFVFLGIDQSTLQLPPLTAEEIATNRAFQLMTEKPFPWSREVWALLLDRLFAAGAHLVMFDMIFSPPNEGDPAFHAALDRYRNRVVLGANFDMANSAQAVTPNGTLIPPPQLQDDRVGFVNFWADPIDGKIRAATYRVTDRELADLPSDSSQEVYQSLSARALAKIGLAIVGVAGLATWLLIVFLRRPLLCLGALVLITAAYLGAARFLYDKTGLLLLTVPVLSALLLSGLFSLGLEYAIERLEKLRTRRTLERYVSKNLVKEVLENPDSYYSSLRGVRIPATVLFSDLIGFTTLSEKADPEALVLQLNEYLSRMTSVVFSNGGTLDKFIGDAIMAVWGNVRSVGMADDAKNCARAALAMRRELRQLNQKWRGEGRMGLGMGIGINQGEVIGGNIGSQERMDPTVIGDSVNLASRLEGLTRIYGVDILVGASAAELARDEVYLRTVARVQVKGKSKPADVFTFVGSRNEEIDPELLNWLEMYEEGLEKFRARHFTDAKILFSRFLEFYPDDLLAKMYLDRALDYEQAPPDEAWDAVEVFEKK